MINTTKGELVFIQSEEKLQESIVLALHEASKWMLEAYKLENLNLSLVTTSSYVEAAFPFHAQKFILKEDTSAFSAQYLKDVYTFINTDTRFCSPHLYSTVTRTPLSDKNGNPVYRKTFVPPLRRGFSTFLVSLHIRKAIVLPFSFHWPSGLEFGHRGDVINRREVCPQKYLPELVRFIRSLDSRKGNNQVETVFNSYPQNRCERFASMSQRLIIAGGWLVPEDVNYDDLLALKVANDNTKFSGNRHLSILMFTELLERKYKDLSPVNPEGWRRALLQSQPARMLDRFELTAGKGNAHLLAQAAEQRAGTMAPEALALLDKLPGINFALKENSKIWITIQRTYLRISRLESDKYRIGALAHLNLYLFAYLPYWYAENPQFDYEFPSAPSKLNPSYFVSDLGLLEGKLRPLSFIEFFNSETGIRNWADSSKYSTLKQIELFFDFIEKYSDTLPGASGFRQPFHKNDYPLIRKSTGTNKRPVPRRVFKLYLAYVESLAVLSSVLLERSISGELSGNQLSFLSPRFATVDCFSNQNSLGLCPIVFYEGKVFPLNLIPNVFNMQVRNLKDGCIANIPHPHGLHQIIASLYTGLRHNHIQWLDCDTFDKLVKNDSKEREFAELYVNSDKVKHSAWAPFVNFKVIEILRLQRAWRELIDEPKFNKGVYYNDNPKTKWGVINALFAYLPDGRPHGDNLYSSCWKRLLGGFQGLLGTVGEHSIQIIRLLPPGCQYDDTNLNDKLFEYGNSEKYLCKIRIATDITPHSTRAGVVSQAISFLPADVIGRYWTGQSSATVYHYVVPDDEEIFAEQQRQNLHLRNQGNDQGYEKMLLSIPASKSPHIKADSLNSNLSQSLKENLETTLTDYGCISIRVGEEGKTGLDILRATRAAGAVENKTEICPYGNFCPPEVITLLKTPRRCGPCPFAVRSIDHLPAITAKIRQVLEGLLEIEERISQAEITNDFTNDEIDLLDETRAELAEDLTAWQMCAEILEIMRSRIASGSSTKSWHVRRPEIIEKDLRRAVFPTDSTEYVLARLQECEVFPMLESPQIRAKFDLLRRNLLANTGNIRAALKFEASTNPTRECLGLIRSIASAHKLTFEDIKTLLESDLHLDSYPLNTLKFFPPDMA